VYKALSTIETKEAVTFIIDIHTNVDGKYPIIIDINNQWTNIETVMEQLQKNSLWTAKNKKVGIVFYEFISNHIYMMIDLIENIKAI